MPTSRADCAASFRASPTRPCRCLATQSGKRRLKVPRYKWWALARAAGRTCQRIKSDRAAQTRGKKRKNLRSFERRFFRFAEEAGFEPARTSRNQRKPTQTRPLMHPQLVMQSNLSTRNQKRAGLPRRIQTPSRQRLPTPFPKRQLPESGRWLAS